MIRFWMAGLWAAFILVAVVGCSTSNVYDPSLTLPASPLKHRQMQLQATGGFYPQTRPREADQALSLGFSGTMRIAATPWLTLQGRYWAADAASGDGLSQGISVSSIVRLDSDSTGFRWSIVPSFGWSTNQSFELEGKGTSLILAAWLPSTEMFQPYVGIGPAYGWSPESSSYTNTGTDSTITDGSRNGWGAILNVGTHCNIVGDLSVVGELTTVLQVNLYDGVAHIIFSPIIGIAYAF
ncbi:MAG TPA: hypothetical protein VK147_12035 [Candidatus Didemnitutus sp.]|nr:hypothetical protein [Candidatus Didemnitutus sp.]